LDAHTGSPGVSRPGLQQWWTRWEGKADANGQCRVRAFYGKYAVTCGAETKQVLLSKEKGQVTVRFE